MPSFPAKQKNWHDLCTGWPITFVKTSCWRQIKSSAMAWPVQARPKRNFIFWCQQEILTNVMGHPIHIFMKSKYFSKSRWNGECLLKYLAVFICSRPNQLRHENYIVPESSWKWLICTPLHQRTGDHFSSTELLLGTWWSFSLYRQLRDIRGPSLHYSQLNSWMLFSIVVESILS